MRGLAPCQQDLRMNAGTALLARTSIKRGDTHLTHARSFLIIVCRLVVPSSVLMILMM